MDATRAADDLYVRVLAPLVLGGTVVPGHALGARVAWSLGQTGAPTDALLVERVQSVRLRRARTLAPVDTVPAIDEADWVLGAALHDVLQAMNPTFDSPLRRYAAARILDIAQASLTRVQPPARPGAALARHTWFARLFDLKRTDTLVSYWLGSRRYLGCDPPRRVQAWPELRRVNIVRERRELLELAPLAVDRDTVALALSTLLARSPLSDVATCTRTLPRFSWSDETLALLDTGAGLRLALRALDRLPRLPADAALGRATRDLLEGPRRDRAGRVISLLAERALASVMSPADTSPATARGDANVRYAQTTGAIAARQFVESPSAAPLAEGERARLAKALDAIAAHGSLT
jgi:hypothetical protein